MKDISNFKAVILAAGSSSRMGKPKQLLKVKGKSMLDHAISAALGAGINTPVVVLGANKDQILDGIELADKCDIIYNSDFTTGQASTLVAGTKRVINSCDAAVFMLADQPFVTAKLIAGMINRFLDERPDLLYPLYQQQRGNPVIISSDLFPRLLTATGDTGARFLFTDSTLKILAHEVDDRSVIIDIDTPEMYQAIK